MSKIMRHEASFYSPKPKSWDGSGCDWLGCVMMKAKLPDCRLEDVPVVRRTGNGDRNSLRKPAVVADTKPKATKKNVLKRPARRARPPLFKTVWGRNPATTIGYS